MRLTPIKDGYLENQSHHCHTSPARTPAARVFFPKFIHIHPLVCRAAAGAQEALECLSSCLRHS